MAPGVMCCFGLRGLSSSVRDPSPENVTADQASEEQQMGGAVLVELFASQGCATSPEAELLLSMLGREDFSLEVPIVVLAYHVDYWDHLGWKDPFGSSMGTVRQKAYVEALKLDTLYTPMVVVHGRAQCMGTEKNQIISAVQSAYRFVAPAFEVSFLRLSPDSLRVGLKGTLRTKVDSKGLDIMVALYETGLVTDCTKGENRGRVLSNDFVVRRLEKLCTVKDFSAKKAVTGGINFSLWDDFNSSKCGVVVFLQNSSLHVFGLQRFELPDNLI